MALATMNFYSRSLNRNTAINVIIPSDTASHPDKGSYKTLYLLHGLTGNYTDWVSGTRIKALAATYNLCVVMPSGDNKFYCDSVLSGDMYGRFIGEELVQFTRDTFRLSPARENTYIGGLSMGGYGAIVNGLRNPNTFSRVIALSSALIKDRILSSAVEPGHDYFTRAQYKTIFGLERIEDFNGSMNDYDALAERLALKNAELPEIYMACGINDMLLPANYAYRDKLNALGYNVTWEDGAGGHDWDYWDTYIEKAIRWLSLDKIN